MKAAKEYLAQLKATKTDGDNLLNEKMNGNLVAAAIGGGLGLVLAGTRGYNYILSGFLGAIITTTLFTLVKPKK